MSEPIAPTRTYYRVFAALIALTLLTVAISFVELGAWHTTVGVLIGVVKASLVGLFFMHLLHSSKASWLAVLAGLFWLAILMGLTLTDYLTRQVLAF
jgi:cytochrome c oxidase subunit 4